MESLSHYSARWHASVFDEKCAFSSNYLGHCL